MKRVIGIGLAAGMAALMLAVTHLEGPLGSVAAMGPAATVLAGVGFIRPSDLTDLWRGVADGPAGVTEGTS